MRLFKEQGLVVDSIRLVHIDGPTGKVVSDREFPRDKGFWHNLAVRLGLAHDTMVVEGFASIIGYMANISPPATPFVNIGIGMGTTPSSVSDTQLQTPLKIKGATVTQITTTNTRDTLQAVATFSSGDGLSGTTVAVTEVVLANGTVNGTSLIALHQVYSPSDVMDWNQGDQLQVTIKLNAKQG